MIIMATNENYYLPVVYRRSWFFFFFYVLNQSTIARLIGYYAPKSVLIF